MTSKSKYTRDIEKKEVFLDEVDIITKISKDEETEKKEIFIDEVNGCQLPQHRQVEKKEKSVEEGDLYLSQAQERSKVNIQHETDHLYSNKQAVENKASEAAVRALNAEKRVFAFENCITEIESGLD